MNLKILVVAVLAAVLCGCESSRGLALAEVVVSALEAREKLNAADAAALKKAGGILLGPVSPKVERTSAK